MKKIIFFSIIIVTININYSYAQIVNSFSAIIVIPIDSSQCSFDTKVVDIEKKFQSYGANKAVWFSRNEYINDPVKFAKSRYYIDFDTTKQFKVFNLNLCKVKIFTGTEVSNLVMKKGRSFFREYTGRIIILSNFSGEYKFYPLIRYETFYAKE